MEALNRKEIKMNKRECHGILDDFSKVYGVTIELKEEPLTPETELIIRDPGNRWVSSHKLVTHTHAELASILDQVKRNYILEAKDYMKTCLLDSSLYAYFKPNNTNLPGIKDVIFNEPATIILWKDGTKTVVKCQEEEGYDPEKGLAMAISKKALGNKGNYCEVFKKWLPEEEVETERDPIGVFERFKKTMDGLGFTVEVVKEEPENSTSGEKNK